MSGQLRHSRLSPARQRLVLLMQQMNFGRIENLLVQKGEPVFAPPPRLVREIRLGGENGSRPEAGVADFALKAPVVELLAHLSEIGSGRIESLEVRHGLPQRLVLVAEAVGGAAA